MMTRAPVWMRLGSGRRAASADLRSEGGGELFIHLHHFGHAVTTAGTANRHP
jgi:hypothetical protein